MNHIYSFKRVCSALLLVVLVMTSLTGCEKKEHSIYDDATVDVPSTYASYSVPPMTFRFEAGWTSGNYNASQEEMDILAGMMGITANLCIFTRMQSPVYDQGTINYIDLGYFQMGHNMTMEELEESMELMDQLSSTVKKMELSCSQLQSARIRCYGENELEALTTCYRVSNTINDFTLYCVEQIALIPVGNKLYVILYSDFTNTEKTKAMEEILSTLSIDELAK